MGPLICGYFPIVNTIVLLGLWLVEFADAEEPCRYGGPTMSYMQINPSDAHGSSVICIVAMMGIK